MAQPDPYNRFYNFVNYQATEPNTPLPAAKVDGEYARIKVTLDQVLNNLAILQRDDAALANASVGLDQLKTEINIGFSAPTTWATATNYILNDTVFQAQKFYICRESHTSGTFATDLAAVKWEEIADFTGVQAAAETAQAAAEAAQAAAETAQAAAETAQSAAASSASAASSSATAASGSASTASSAASAASSSASAAGTAQTASETAQSAAETAETNAETAETNAETAQAAAEVAQAAAEAAVDLDATLISLAGLNLVEGDILYATAADTLQRLAKGTAAQSLVMNAGATAPEWATASSAAYTKIIDAVTLTGASWEMNTFSYDEAYIFIKDAEPSGTNARLRILFSDDAGSTDEITGYVNFSSSDTTYGEVYAGSGWDNGGTLRSFWVHLVRQGNGMFWEGSPFDGSFQNGYFDNTAVVDAIKLYPDSGTISAGTVTMWAK